MSTERIEQERKWARYDRVNDHPVCQALRSCEFGVIRSFVSEMFDYELSDHEALSLCVSWNGQKRFQSWKVSAGPAIWIKNRLIERGAFRTNHSPPFDFAEAATAVLHVFFLALEETTEMLERLKNDDAQFASKVARSKLFSSPLVTSPIDSLTLKVSGDDPKRKQK